MLQVAIARLKSLCPDAIVEVVTDYPAKLLDLCPGTIPIPANGRRIWFSPLFYRFDKIISNTRIAEKYQDLVWKFRCYFPSLVRFLLELKLKVKPQQSQDLKEYIESVYNADIIITPGGGTINDIWEDWSSQALSILGMTVTLNKVALMFGQGLGPLENPKLLIKAKEILPSVHLIALRENLVGPTLLTSIGVSPGRMIVTGDDAIELAYDLCPENLGYGVGVNLRVADYANINQDNLEIIRSTLQSFASQKQAPLIPVPISYICGESDTQTIKTLLEGYNDNPDGGEHLNTPLHVIQQVGLCRVVITGSYHAGVFALSQGVPVIALTKSQYYQDKFLGLKEQFGLGCEILFIGDKDLPEILFSKIANAWENAEELRPKLLQAAKLQIESGYLAYRKAISLALENLKRS